MTISVAVAAELPESVIAQHNKGASYNLSDDETQFTFIGGFDSISEESFLTPQGEMWTISLSVEKVVLGKYKEERVRIGTHDKNDSTFEPNKKYYITIDWGMHGMLLMGYQEIE